MLKHVRSSAGSARGSWPKPTTLKRQSHVDTISLDSSTVSYFSCSSSTPLSSRCSSYASLPEAFGTPPQHPFEMASVKVYAQCLRSDLHYKTLSISHRTTAQQIVAMLLSKFKMRHRDPKLFYLTMELVIKTKGMPVRTLMILDDNACPAELQSCHPKGESRFALRMREGGVVRVYDGRFLVPGAESSWECARHPGAPPSSHSQPCYKCLLISDRTSAEEVVQLMLNCSGPRWREGRRFALSELCLDSGHERHLGADEAPLLVSRTWPDARSFTFLLKQILESVSRWNFAVILDGGEEEEDEAGDLVFSRRVAALPTAAYHGYLSI